MTPANKSKMTPWFRRTIETANSFRNSRILLTAIELDIFSRLGKARMTSNELALRLKTNARATALLLNALVGLRLLRKHGDRYSNTTSGRRFLVRESPEYRGAFLVHIARCWHPWQELTHIIKTGETAKYEQPTEAAAFARAMYDLGMERAEEVASLLDLTRVRRVLDLGGGPGHYALEIAKRCTSCQITVFDHSDILEITEEKLALHTDIQSRVSTMAGDFLSDDIGADYDLIIASNIIHSYGEENVQEIILKAAAALSPHGQVVIHDFLLDDSLSRPAEAAVFAVYMLIVTGVGRSYSVPEVIQWMEKAGLVDCRHQPLRNKTTSLLIGKHK